MSNRLYVGNLSFDTTEEAIAEAFGQDSRRVKEVSVVMDRDTGRPRGFAFVEMASENDALAAISALDGKELDGRTLRVNTAQERAPRSGGGGGGYRGGGGGGRGGTRDAGHGERYRKER
ncbi:MAG: RNA recognition motif domain-containing protein [Planctomycetota bacterium]|jgi:RNA recognition motif-containing protein